jgi:cytoskeletal protein CcmA (bactofilin family)
MADNDFVVKNGLVVNTNVLVVNGATNKVGVNTATPDAAFSVVGTANVSGNVTLSANLYVAGNTTINGRFEVTNNAYVDRKLYVGNTDTMIQDLPTIIQAVDNFNGFVMISSQNLSKLDDACADLITYADNTNGLSHFNDIGINNSRFDGTIHRIITNANAGAWQLNETVFQKNGAGANIAVGVIRDIVSINATAVSLKISVNEDDGLQTYVGISDFVPTTGANLAIRAVTSAANADILFAVPFFSPVANTLNRRNYGFTVGRRGDGYLYNANSALTIGTTAGGMRVTEYSLSLSTFSSAQTTIHLSSGNTDLLYADMIVTGTGIPVDAYIRSITNSTAFVLSKATTAGSAGTYIARDPYYDATGNPIIFHVNGMMAKDEVGRFTGNGNFTIGANTTARNSKLTVAGTANITGNVAFGNNITVAGNSTITGTVNAAVSVLVGANVNLTTANLTIANGASGTANLIANAIVIRVANTLTAANLTPAGLWVGNTNANATVNSTVYTGTANNTSFVGTVTAANVVSNTQLQSNLALYQTLAGMDANVAVRTANNTSFVGTVTAANVVSNAQLSANLSNYQTLAGMQANVAKLTANDSAYFANQLPSYYTNATNITTGTLPVARISGNYTGITNVGTLGVLTVTGNTTLNNFSTTSNSTTSANVITVGAANVNFDSGVLFVDAVNNRVGVGNTTPDAALKVEGGANITSNLWIGGNFTVAGSLTTTGTFQATGDINPVSNNYNLGSATKLWNLTGNNVTVSNVGTATFLATTSANVGANVVANTSAIKTGNASNYSILTHEVGIETTGTFIVGNTSTMHDIVIYDNTISVGNSAAAPNVRVIISGANIKFGNNVTNSTINSTSFTGTANNASNLNGQAPSYYIDATNLTGTVPAARLPTGNSSTIGGLQIVDSLTNTSITITASANNVRTAYNSAIDANTRAASAQTAATAAYTNAVANAVALSSAAYTNAVANAVALATAAYTNAVANAVALSSAAYTNAVSYVTGRIVDSIVNTSTTHAASLNSVKAAYDSAILANTRATSAQTAAVAAYSNAVTYIDTKSSAAYTNAVANAVALASAAYSNAVANAVALASNAYSNATSYTDTIVTNYALKSGTTFTGAVIVSNNLTVSNSVTITGNLTVSGTTFYANTTNLDVKDKNITVAKGIVDAPSADGAGITVDFVDVAWNYNHATVSWQSNVSITPSTNNTLTLGKTGLVWSNAFFSNVYSTNITGTLQTISQPNITANNSLYLGGTIASGYQTTAGLSANVATLTSNNTSFVGTVTAANVVSNTQLSSNLANYVTTSSLATSVTTASLSVGANVVMNTANLNISNGASGTANIQASATLLKVANTTGVANLTPYNLTIGTTTVGNNQMSTNTFTIKGGASDWTVAVATNSLIFAYGGVNKMKLDTTGNLTVVGDVTAYGTI